ncbi:TonB-dependent receptor [soil metagenome]
MSVKKHAIRNITVTVLLGGSHAVFAQASVSAQESSAAQAAGRAGGVEEIVVTAQKRDERLQDVPISINAISGAGAEQRGVKSSDELVSVVPALTWNKTYNGSPYLRGIGSALVAVGNESSVAIFVDGVLQISPWQSNFAFNNLERIEVLKGPQGTLFGRNANGGVISIFTKDPTTEKASLDVSAGYGNFKTLDGNLYANAPITDTLSANLSAGYHNQREGWGTNITTGKDVFRNRSFDVRGKLRWEAGDRTDLVLTGEYHDMFDESATNRVAAGTFGRDGSGTPGFYNSANDFHSFVDTKIYGGSLRVTHDMDWAKFVSITGYTHLRSLWSFDSDAVAAPLVQGPLYVETQGWTQEFQLVSPSGNPLKWIVGLYYLDTSAALNPITLFGTDFGGATVEVFGRTKARSIAPFGEATWEFLPQTHLTVGGRFTFDYRDINGHVDVNGAPGAVSTGSTHFSEPTYRITLDHRFGKELMLFGTISTGYNSGQYNTGNAAAPPVQPEKLQAYEVGFKSDLLDRRLVINASGFWYDYKDLQVTVIQNAVTVQTNAAKARVKGFDFDISAAPIDNLTLQIGGTYTNAKYTKYNNAQIYVPLPTGGYTSINGDASGRYLVNAPKYSLSMSAQYKVETEVGSFLPSVNYSYRSKKFWNYQNDFVEPSSNEVNASLTFTPESKRWDVRLWAKNILDDKINASGVSRLEGYLNAPAAPRTYGVSVGFHL